MFEIGDAREASPTHAISSWIFDPPYNIGYKYGAVGDSLPEADYAALIRGTAARMYEHSEAASMFLVNYPDIAARLLPHIEVAGWSLRQWLTWCYPSNIGHSKKRFTRASRAVLWFTKGEPEVAIDAVTQPYKNPTDKRVRKLIENGSTGTNLYDWWEINMRKNVSKGYAGWANQLPRELVRRLILTTTAEGDWVGDLMAGSGTTAEVALSLGRNVYIRDIDEAAATIWTGIAPQSVLPV